MSHNVNSSETPRLTLHFLQASRSIRIAWLLEELNLPYELVFYPRVNNKTPEGFAEKSGNKLGKAPVLVDGDLVVSESGAITEYLIETYDSNQTLLGGKDNRQLRNHIRTFIHAAEGTLMVHAVATTYARWFAPSSFTDQKEEFREFEKGLGVNVCRDLDWLDGELKGKRFLAGQNVSAADTMCLFGVQFIFKRNLCGERKIGEWTEVERWVKECEGTESWKRAVEKTGHAL